MHANAGDVSQGATGMSFGLHAVPLWRPWQVKLQRLLQQHQSAATRQERDQLNSHFASTLVEQARELSEEFSRSGGSAQSGGRADEDLRKSSGAASAEQLNGLALLAVATIFDMALAQQAAPQVRSMLASSSGPLAKEDAAMASAWQMFLVQASSSLGLRPTMAAAPAPDGSLRRLPSFDSPKSPPRRAIGSFGSQLGNASSNSLSLGSPSMGARKDGTMPRNMSELFLFEQ
jgi:hypothetical protein